MTYDNKTATTKNIMPLWPFESLWSTVGMSVTETVYSFAACPVDYTIVGKDDHFVLAIDASDIGLGDGTCT